MAMIMIEVYKTNVRTKAQSQKVVEELGTTLAGARINFDLQDCDRILRIQHENSFDIEQVKVTVASMGFCCEVLP